MGEKRQRKSYTNQLKAKVALEAIKGQRTINEIASDYELHPNLVNQWKRQAIEKMQEAFSSKQDREAEKEEELRDRLYREIGQLKVECKPSVIRREISMPLLYAPLRTHFTSPEEIYGFHFPAGSARSQTSCRSLAHHPSLHS